MEKLTPGQWADTLRSFYNEDNTDYKQFSIERISEDILDSPEAENYFISEDEAYDIAEKVHKILSEQEEESEQTPFNNSEIFVNEFKSYLVGKSIYANGDKVKIINIYSEPKDNLVKINYLIKGTDTETGLYITKENFQQFIDGEEVNTENLGKIQLILQEDIKEENLYNKPEYRYYVINKENKILSGFEYKEDAIEDAEKKKMYGESVLVVGKKDLLEKDINPDCDECWSVNEHDWAIIETCLNKCSDEGGCSPKEAAKYLKEFKEEGKYLNVIKGALLQCLERAQIKLRGAYAMSNLESVNEKCDENCRIQKELKRLIAMEK